MYTYIYILNGYSSLETDFLGLKGGISSRWLPAVPAEAKELAAADDVNDEFAKDELAALCRRKTQQHLFVYICIGICICTNIYTRQGGVRSAVQ